MVGRQTLQRADRCPVVAVLGVVVVLDDDRSALGGPANHRGPVPRGQDGPGGPLVRRRQDDGIGLAVPQQVDPDAVTVDRDPDHLEPGRACGREGVVTGGRVLQRQPFRARGGQHVDEQRHALRVAGADHHVIRFGHGAANPVQVAGQRRAQLRHAAPGQVAEHLVRGVSERTADGPQPRGPGEAGHVGAAVTEVDGRLGLARRTQRRGRRSRSGRHLRVPARTAAQVPLGGQLLVGLDHDPAGDAEVGWPAPAWAAGRIRAPAGPRGSPPGSRSRSAGAAESARHAAAARAVPDWSWFQPSDWTLSPGPISVRVELYPPTK